MTARTKHQCVQGDSFALDFSSDDVPVFDGTWTGTWAIVDELGAAKTTLATGAMALSGDLTKIELRVLPADTADIPAGWYVLVGQITNVSLGFNQEVIQDPFEITEQGA